MSQLSTSEPLGNSLNAHHTLTGNKKIKLTPFIVVPPTDTSFVKFDEHLNKNNLAAGLLCKSAASKQSLIKSNDSVFSSGTISPTSLSSSSSSSSSFSSSLSNSPTSTCSKLNVNCVQKTSNLSDLNNNLNTSIVKSKLSIENSELGKALKAPTLLPNNNNSNINNGSTVDQTQNLNSLLTNVSGNTVNVKTTVHSLSNVLCSSPSNTKQGNTVITIGTPISTDSNGSTVLNTSNAGSSNTNKISVQYVSLAYGNNGSLSITNTSTTSSPSSSLSSSPITAAGYNANHNAHQHQCNNTSSSNNAQIHVTTNAPGDFQQILLNKNKNANVCKDLINYSTNHSPATISNAITNAIVNSINSANGQIINCPVSLSGNTAALLNQVLVSRNAICSNPEANGSINQNNPSTVVITNASNGNQNLTNYNRNAVIDQSNHNNTITLPVTPTTPININTNTHINTLTNNSNNSSINNIIDTNINLKNVSHLNNNNNCNNNININNINMISTNNNNSITNSVNLNNHNNQINTTITTTTTTSSAINTNHNNNLNLISNLNSNANISNNSNGSRLSALLNDHRVNSPLCGELGSSLLNALDPVGSEFEVKTLASQSLLSCSLGGRTLISPTDFLTLTEDDRSSGNGPGVTGSDSNSRLRTSSAVKRDVSLSSGCLSVSNDLFNNNRKAYSGYERLCDSPLFLDHEPLDDEDDLKEKDFICADDLLFGASLDDSDRFDRFDRLERNDLNSIVRHSPEPNEPQVNSTKCDQLLINCLNMTDTKNKTCNNLNARNILMEPNKPITLSSNDVINNKSICGNNSVLLNQLVRGVKIKEEPNVPSTIDNLIASSDIATSSNKTNAQNSQKMIISCQSSGICSPDSSTLVKHVADSNISNVSNTLTINNNVGNSTVTSTHSNDSMTIKNLNPTVVTTNNITNTNNIVTNTLINSNNNNNSSHGTNGNPISTTTVSTVNSNAGNNNNTITFLPAGLLQLAANIAAVFPTTQVQKQIALQLLREDGTSIIVPISTKTAETSSVTSSGTNNSGLVDDTIKTNTLIKNESGDLSNDTKNNLILTSNVSNTINNNSNSITSTVANNPAATQLITISADSLSNLMQAGLSGNVLATIAAAGSGNQTVSVTGNTTLTAPGTSNSTVNPTNNNDQDRPFKCELCNSTFTRLGNYTRHKKIHSLPSKDQRFKCDICGKSFIQRCDLARHLHIHRGTEPHRCPQCGKGYIRHSDLVTHQRFHNKEKPFACPHCSKGFCQRGDLNRHLRSIHLQLKPILCTHCHKKFAKEETLLRHINANHR